MFVMRGLLLVLIIGCQTDGMSDAGADAHPDVATDVGFDVGGSDVGLHDVGDSGEHAAVDASSVDAPDAPDTDAPDSGAGLDCVVLADHAPTDVATLGSSRWLAAGRRLVRVDLSFDDPVEELVAEGERIVESVHATTTDVFTVTKLRRGGLDSRVLRRDASGWEDVTPPGLISATHTLAGDDVAFVSTRLGLFRWNSALSNWSEIALPDSSIRITEFSATGEQVYLHHDRTLWVYDGASWTGTSLDSLGTTGPPLPPISSITIPAPTPTADGSLIFTYRLTRTSGPGEDGIARLRDGVLTNVGDFPPGGDRIWAVDSGYVNPGTRVEPSYRSTDLTTWIEVPNPPSFQSTHSFAADGDEVFALVDRQGVYGLGDTSWVLRRRHAIPSLLRERPDSRVAPATAYGIDRDYDSDEVRFTRWDGLGWSRTDVEAPPGATWVGDTAYYLSGGSARRWRGGVEENLPSGSFDHLVASETNVYVAERFGEVTHEVKRLAGSSWVDLPGFDCVSAFLVPAGLDGLLQVGCDAIPDDDRDGFPTYWLNGDAWSVLADMDYLGHIGGRSGTAVLADRMAGTYPTFAGTWSTLDLSWADGDVERVTGPDTDNLVAHYGTSIRWRREGAVSGLDDDRAQQMGTAVVQDARIIARFGRHESIRFERIPTMRSRYLFDCEL